MILTRQEIIETLQFNECEVTFTKVNGEIRVMPCTLKEGIIPAAPVDITSKSNVKRLENQNVVSAWCTDKREWRSFRVDNVTELKIKFNQN